MANETITKHQGHYLGGDGEYAVIDCLSCEYAHVDPVPSVEELLNVYDEKFYREDKPDYLLKTEREYDYWSESVYRWRYEDLERLLPPGAGKRLLEIGCSGGFFLRYGKSRGWQVLGVEPSIQASQYAKAVSGVEVIRDYIQNIPLEQIQGAFDVVHLQYVLEHVPNPLEVCQRAFEALTSGGLICVEVPNDFNPLQKLANLTLGNHDYWVSIPHHLNYFNAESLSKLLARAGFTVLEQEASFPMEFFQFFGENYVGNEAVGLACHQKRMRFEMAFNQLPEADALRKKLYQCFATLGIGRTLTIFAQKP